MAFSAIGTGLARVTACLTKLIGPIIVVSRQTDTPDIILIKNPEFIRTTSGASRRIGTQSTRILASSTCRKFAFIELRLTKTLIVVENSARYTSRTVSCRGCTFKTRVVAKRTLFDPNVKISLLAHALVCNWVEFTVCSGVT